MKGQDFNYIISILLLFSITITALLGYIQAQWELRRFIPHRYFAYITLTLTAMHVCLNIGKVLNYFRRKLPKDIKQKATGKET